MRPLLLLTNDDGFFAEGVQILKRKLKDLGAVFIVAPDREKSATSLSLTLRRPLRLERIKRDVFAVDGTPADCVYLALQTLLPRPPDLLISGINQGPNLGQQDISYSGTVAAAIQGTFLRLPSLAVSAIPDRQGCFHLDSCAEFVRRLALKLLQHKLPEGLTLNVNLPPPPVKGVRITRLGEKRYTPEIVEKKDPRDKTYYWIGSGKPRPLGGGKSDVRAVESGYISVTPIHTDLTHYEALASRSFKRLFQDLA